MVIYKIKPFQALLEFFEVTLVCSAVAFVCYFLVGQILEVSGDSMTPTINNGEHLFAEKFSIKLVDLKRGEIIVFKRPEENNDLVIKRVIGLPGETVTLQNGLVYINRMPLSEPYLPQNTTTLAGAFLQNGINYPIPTDSYLVLGDNRAKSIDSRNWGFLKKSNILGRALFVYKPLKNARFL